MIALFTFRNVEYRVSYDKDNELTRHGGPFDRGGADSYYRRPNASPHWYPEGTYKGERITKDQMTPDEIEQYHAGFAYNEHIGDYKDWG